MILDDKLLDEVTARAKTSERLRMNFNLHDSLDAKAQRLLNALEPGTALPVHRHPHTLKGVYGIHVPKGQWHTLEVLESGTVLFEVKDGPYAPLAPEDMVR